MSDLELKLEAQLIPTCTHWGNYLVEKRDGRIAAIHSYPEDPNPTPIGQSLMNSMDPDSRIPQPMVRAGYLEHQWESDGRGRGVEPFVPVSWETALDLATGALIHVKDHYGNEAIYGGSYGWASAGRFHHAQSHVHRFLNCIGGYTRSVNSYSTAAAEVIMPHVTGIPFMHLVFHAPTAEDIVKYTRTMVLFGGAAMKNTQVNHGGLGAHTARDQLLCMKNSGLRVVNVSPVRGDAAGFLEPEWWACRPNSDVAIMLGLAHTLVREDLHDQEFLDRYCEGFERFLPYLLGQSDGIVKDAEWASALSDIPANDIRQLARDLAKDRSVLGISWSLQRQQHGEQTYWMITTLGAMLGHIGLPGGGVAYGYGCIHNMGFSGRKQPPFKVGALPQGQNPVASFIPVSRISDMLLKPGGTLDYNGQQLVFPEIHLIYWAGGNPFHHHQDLNRLRLGWAKPGTVIVNEGVWTATARHADIVFPCQTMMERNDFGMGSTDCYISPMRQVVEPFAEARTDYQVFSGLAGRLGLEREFTEGRDEMQWVQHLYDQTRENAAQVNITLPKFDEFWQGQQISFREQVPDISFPLEDFRTDPDTHPLKTPSGKIEIFSETIAAYGYEDCAGHPTWFEKSEFLGSHRSRDFPLHLVSNQPKTRLHSQYDHGVTSRKSKIRDREPMRMNPQDAEARGIAAGDVVRIFNDRGACLAGVQLSNGIRAGVIELATGAWYDPVKPEEEKSLEAHGNPNVLTRDIGTSKLAQGPTAHSCLVQVERFDQPLPPVKVFQQPEVVTSGEWIRN